VIRALGRVVPASPGVDLGSLRTSACGSDRYLRDRMDFENGVDAGDGEVIAE